MEMTALILLLFTAIPRSQVDSVNNRGELSASNQERQQTANYSFISQECVSSFPCFATASDTEDCDHAIGIPENLGARIELSGKCGILETLIIGWNPSKFGITFLQGFQVRVRSIDSSNDYTDCRQLAIRERGKLSSEMLVETTFCVPAESQYLIAVNAYPIPQGREREARIIVFQRERPSEPPAGFSPDCNRLFGSRKTECLRRWVPENIIFKREWTSVILTFEPAPENYGFHCYHISYGQIARGRPRPERWQHISVPHEDERTVTASLGNLQPGYNYSVMIYSDFLNARRRRVTHFVSTDDDVTFPVIWLVIGLGAIAIISIVSGTFIATRVKKKSGNPEEFNNDMEFGNKGKESQEPNGFRNIPKVFLCYCNRDGEKTVNMILYFAAFLQEHCGCRVVLDLWERLAISCEGQLEWLSCQIRESDYVIVVASKGPEAGMEMRAADPGRVSQEDLSQGVSFSVAVSMIAQKLCQAVAHRQDLSKFIVASFSHTGHGEIPDTLQLASKYQLMTEFPQLFAHLHSMELCRPGYTVHVDKISLDTYWQTPTGLNLYHAIAALCSDNIPQTFTISDTAGREGILTTDINLSPSKPL